MTERFIQELVPVGGGNSFSIDVDSGVDLVSIDPGSPITLTGAVNITATGTLTANQYVEFLYKGDITSDTVSGFGLTILGSTLSNAQALGEALITAHYNGSAWDVMVFPTSEATVNIDGADIVAGSIETASYKDASVTNAKLATLTEGFMKIGNSSNVPTDIDASGDTKVLIGNGTTAAAYALSGAITMTNTGVTTIPADYVTEAMLAFTPLTYEITNVTLPTSDVLEMYSVPKLVIPAPGANKITVIVGASIFLDYNSIGYAGGGTIELVYAAAATTSVWSAPANSVTGSVDTFAQMREANTKLTSAVNQAVNITNFTAALTTGNSPLKVSIISYTLDVS